MGAIIGAGIDDQVVDKIDFGVVLSGTQEGRAHALFDFRIVEEARSLGANDGVVDDIVAFQWVVKLVSGVEKNTVGGGVDEGIVVKLATTLRGDDLHALAPVFATAKNEIIVNLVGASDEVKDKILVEFTAGGPVDDGVVVYLAIGSDQVELDAIPTDVFEQVVVDVNVFQPMAKAILPVAYHVGTDQVAASVADVDAFAAGMVDVVVVNVEIAQDKAIDPPGLGIVTARVCFGHDAREAGVFDFNVVDFNVGTKGGDGDAHLARARLSDVKTIRVIGIAATGEVNVFTLDKSNARVRQLIDDYGAITIDES